MDIKRNGSQPSGKGPAEWFTGNVRIDPLFQPNDTTRANGSSVTFEPGARTAWHRAGAVERAHSDNPSRLGTKALTIRHPFLGMV
jgi:quercetin dioxygenase-like cupin family protein